MSSNTFKVDKRFIHFLIWLGAILNAISVDVLASMITPKFQGRIGIVLVFLFATAIPSMLPKKSRTLVILILMLVAAILSNFFSSIAANLMGPQFRDRLDTALLLFVTTSIAGIIGVAYSRTEKLGKSKFNLSIFRLHGKLKSSLRHVLANLQSISISIILSDLPLTILYLCYKYLIILCFFWAGATLYFLPSVNRCVFWVVLGIPLLIGAVTIGVRSEEISKRSRARSGPHYLSLYDDIGWGDEMAERISERANEVFPWESFDVFVEEFMLKPKSQR